MNAFEPLRNALSMYMQTASLPAQAAQTIAMDRRQQEQNAMANAMRTLQMEEIQRRMQKEQGMTNALSGLFSPQRQPGTGPMRGIENYQPGAMQTPQPSFTDIRSRLAPFGVEGLSVAEKFKPSSDEYQIIEGQYVPKTPGGSAMPIPGFVPQEKKPLVDMSGFTIGGGETAQFPGAKKYFETMGTKQAERQTSLNEQASSAMERRYATQVQRASIADGLQTGAFAPLVNAVASYVEGFGLDPQKLRLPDPSKGQVFDVATFDNLLKALQAQKGPQTEGDAARALKTFAGMKNTKEANMFILDYMDELADRTQNLSDFVNDNAATMARTSNTPVLAAEKKYRDWARRHPAVAVSKNSGLPITYGAYKKAAIASGMPEAQVDAEWRKFAGVK